MDYRRAWINKDNGSEGGITRMAMDSSKHTKSKGG